MPDGLIGLLKDTLKKALEKVSDRLAGWIVAALVALLSLARPLWRQLGVWFFSIDPEVARQAVFLLFVVLGLLILVAPRRRLSIAVRPLRHPGDDALLEVTNLGPRAVFYASAEILDVHEEDIPGNFRQMTLRPTWVGELGHNWVTLKPHQVGSLCLATHLPIEEGMMSAQFCDVDGRGQLSRWPPQHEPGLLALARVTIMLEKITSRIPMWRPAIPFSAVFVITGDGEGGLWVKPARFKRHPWWSRPAMRLSNLEEPKLRRLRIRKKR
jgi:hypothetical protein